MKKVLKFLLLFVVLIVVAGLAIGFLASPQFEEREDFVIDAPIGKVWSVISDPSKTKDWLPAHSEEEKIVEVKTPGALETLAKAGEQVAKTGDVDVKKLTRHTYVQKNGATITVEVEESERNKRYMEHVVQETAGMSKFFPDVRWGFELAEAEGGKTKLTPVMRGTAAKPLGTLMNRVMRWTGQGSKFRRQMATNVETLAKK